MPLMNQTLKKVQIKTGRSEIHTNEDEFVENKTAYNRQLNYCISLLRKTKKEYFADLNEQNDNKQFWRTVKPELPDKIKLSNNTYLVEDGEIINEDDKNATVLKNFFISPLKSGVAYLYPLKISQNLKVFCCF